jgi:hypothetical protein
MTAVLFIALMVISFVGYALVVALSIIPVNPTVASRGQYVVFIVYGSLFYVISTMVHVAPLLLFDTYFVRPENRRKRFLPLVLPTAMLLYLIYVIAFGR